MKEWCMFICLAIGFFGCARTMTDFAPFTTDSSTSPKEEKILLASGDIDRPYKELGIIVVRGRRTSGSKMMKSLTTKAREVGANAVIKIECGRPYYRRHCRGVAVSFE